MEMFFICLVIVLAAAAVIMLLRLIFYRKQVSHIIKELLFLNAEESNLLLTSAYPIGKTKELFSSGTSALCCIWR